VTIRFYYDEDSQAHSILQPLRARGIDVETAADAGMLGRDDEDQPPYTTSRRAVPAR
jgi:hypothetical protein